MTSANVPDHLMQRIGELGPNALAYVGDAVYTLFVRGEAVSRGPASPHQLHKATVCEVRAAAQAHSLALLEGQLSEDEKSIVRWARNARIGKGGGGTPAQRHQATAFEALLGYLYLTGQSQRLASLLTLVVGQATKHGGDEDGRKPAQIHS